MKKLLISALATALVASFAVSTEAAGNKQKVSADIQASCKAQAAKKYSAIHFMKRRDFVNNCVAQHAKASAPKAKSTNTGQRINKLSDLKAPLRRGLSCGLMDCASMPPSCPLWVISGHSDSFRQCPLYPNSGDLSKIWYVR